MYLKIKNFMKNGKADYKGLDLQSIIAGSQVYPDHLEYCLVQTTEADYKLHDDIEELSVEQYETERQAVIDSQPKPYDPQQEIETLKLQNAQMMLALVMNDLI